MGVKWVCDGCLISLCYHGGSEIISISFRVTFPTVLSVVSLLCDLFRLKGFKLENPVHIGPPNSILLFLEVKFDRGTGDFSGAS